MKHSAKYEGFTSQDLEFVYEDMMEDVLIKFEVYLQAHDVMDEIEERK